MYYVFLLVLFKLCDIAISTRLLYVYVRMIWFVKAEFTIGIVVCPFL